MKTALYPLLVLATSVIAFAAELPEAVVPAGVGVNIHFITGHEKDLDLIAAAGFRFIRMDFAWAGIERKKGEYDWTGYEQLQANLEKRNLRPIYILDYSNPLYEENNASPQHPESVAAYARWAAAAAKHFQGRHIIWEIWNEPNIPQFWKPKPDAQQYSALCLAACKAIRETDPAATIIAPASSGFPWDFFEGLFKAGALEYLDAVSVHPYREYRRGPETAAADYQKLRELIERYAPDGKKKLTILSGEWGYATHAKGVSLEKQAAFAARQQLSNLIQGVPLSIWYDWKNDGSDPNDAEHNFGTVLPDLTPKPAYLALQTLTRELNGFHFSKRLPLADEQDYVVVFANSKGEEKIAAWTCADTHPVEVQIRPEMEKALRTLTGTGPGFPQRLEKGRLKMQLAPAPQYVTLGATTVKTD